MRSIGVLHVQLSSVKSDEKTELSPFLSTMNRIKQGTERGTELRTERGTKRETEQGTERETKQGTERETDRGTARGTGRGTTRRRERGTEGDVGEDSKFFQYSL